MKRYLIEEKTGKKVRKMHLYYTGDEYRIHTVTFNKSKDKNLCANCDMRHFCR